MDVFQIYSAPFLPLNTLIFAYILEIKQFKQYSGDILMLKNKLIEKEAAGKYFFAKFTSQIASQMMKLEKQLPQIFPLRLKATLSIKMVGFRPSC